MNSLLEPAIGICRFSFCGKGDWQTSRAAKTSEQIEDMRAAVADELYAPERMELRFFLFENFLLPSLKAQSDPNFTCLILTSDVMPQHYLDRLHALCADCPVTEVLVSSESTVHKALWPRISALNEQAGRPLVTFRIDDDDCLSSDYVQKMRGYMFRLSDQIPLGYSRASGLVITNYKADGAMHIYKANLPFNSMGTALRVHGERTVFSFGHNALHKRFPAIVDNSGMGYISIKIDGHDSIPISMTMPHIKNSHKPIEEDQIEETLSRWFSFLGTEGQPYHAALVAKITQAAALAGQTSITSPS